MRRVLIIFTLLFIFLSSIIALAGTSGKISGRIINENTGEPLIGANILIKNSYLGASTDMDGYYIILNVPPGSYVLQVMYIGFNTIEISEVRVSVDLTTKIDVKLSETTLDATETITVVAQRDAVQKDITATTAIISNEQIDALPVTEISEVLQLQAGFVEGHVRGGRSGEVAYWIDGIPITDAFDGGQVVEVNKDMVEELQFISGAFNAEYGYAMSGIVNIITKEPSDKFGGNFTTYVGDYYSTHDIFWNLNNFNPQNIYNFEGGIYGIIFPNKLSYYLNSRYIYFGGWYYGREVYEPHNITYKDNITEEFVEFRDENGEGSGEYVPMNWNRKFYAQGKLIYNITPLMKLNYSYVLDDVKYQDYNRYYRVNPNGDLNRFRTGSTHLLKLTYMISKSTFCDLGFSYFNKTYKNYVYEDKSDTNYVHTKVGANIPNYNFSTGGMNNQHFRRDTKTSLIKFDLTSQITKRHLLKTGIEYRKHKIFFDDISLQPKGGTGLDYQNDSPFMDPVVEPISTFYHSKYERKPWEFSVYIQDKMEFEDLIVNIGVRFDHFNSNGTILSDPSDPNIYDPIRPENRYHDIDGNGSDTEDINGNGELDPGEDLNSNGLIDEDPEVTLAEREEYWYKDADPKTQISPRLGVSFPVTETGVVHFSYGYFFQTPVFEYLYRNAQFKISDEPGNQGVVGNSDLKPEQTISGEIGYKQEIGTGLTIDVTVYFRDIRELVGTRADEIETARAGTRYSVIVNSDFGYVKGIILSLKKRYGLGLNYTLDYTFQIADGTASDPNQSRDAYAAGNKPEVLLVPLSWDQRHTLNTTVNYIENSWGLSFIGNLGSGAPYTPRKTVDVSGLRENSEKKPITWNVDMRLYKDFTFFDNELTCFLRVFNLFDHLNEIGVFDDTGNAGYTTDLEKTRSLNPDMLPGQTLDEWFANETFYSEPRRIEVGFTIKF